LETLLLASKEEEKKKRTSNRDHPSTNRSTEHATILSTVKKAGEKATSELALRSLKNDKFITSRLNNNPTHARAQDIKQFNTQNQHHLPCPNCELSSVMAVDTYEEVAAKNAEIKQRFAEKVGFLTGPYLIIYFMR
jgi:Zn finger protein HypA/HybF involved in hydrogenase expression